MVLEWLAFLLLAAAGLGVWGWVARREGRVRVAVVAAVVASAALGTVAAGAAFSGRRREGIAQREAARAMAPREGRPGGYVSSDACRACHPAQHASWHRSYHRTMTQQPSAQAVLAPFEGVAPLPVKGGLLHLSRRGEDGFWVRRVPDGPAAGGASPMHRDFRVALLTGSHHMQIYWVNSGGESAGPSAAPPPGGDPGNRLEMFPYAYLIADRRWVPARDTFLADPQQQWSFDVWNTQCLQCHVTGGQPRVRPDGQAMESRVAETGIGCESCHGPGQAHVARMQNPARRYGVHLAAAPSEELAIVNPARLPPRAASEVCGQCHGYFAVTDWASFARDGFSYRPGEPLERSKPTMHPDLPASAPYLAAARASDPRFEASIYWPDGDVRVTGREWTALQRSACHLRGGLTCLSCHSMHASEPDDQLAAGRAGNQACLGCHRELAASVSAHTRHGPDSSGSLCYNCHMPYTTYGLLKAVRSHGIDSPRVASTLKTGRPNACNQCHLDRTLEWTATHLESWHGQAAPPLADRWRTTAASVLWAIQGDAGQRALVAANMGWDEARATSGVGWMTPFLILALSDPYSAVRYIAGRSLRKSPGLEDVDYDYVAPRETLERRVQAIIERWGAQRAREPDAARADRLLLHPDGSLVTARVEALLDGRDERSLELRE